MPNGFAASMPETPPPSLKEVMSYLGKLGGKAKTDAKARAARLNGKRPKKKSDRPAKAKETALADK